MKKVLVIDGQGGRLGAALIEGIRADCPACTLVAVGTNSLATAAMLRAGADAGATGENPVLVQCRDAAVILGPVGILAADALYGEVTPAMAAAVGRSEAHKLLLPMNRCRLEVVGVQEQPVARYIQQAVERLRVLLAGK